VLAAQWADQQSMRGGVPDLDEASDLTPMPISPREGLALTFEDDAGVPQLAEQLFCKQVVSL